MVWYITTELKFEFMGGVGHTMCDIYSSYFIAECYGLEHVHYPFPIIKGEEQHSRSMEIARLNRLGTDLEKFTLGTLIIVSDYKWDIFFGLKEGEREYSDLKCKVVYINNLCARFRSIPKQKLDAFFAKYNREEDILFILSNNNRAYSDLANKFPIIYRQLRLKLQEKCIHKAQTKNRLLLHVRRGDMGYATEPLSYFTTLLNTVLQYVQPLEIVVMSCGSPEECLEIRDAYKAYKNVRFELNTDTIESFKIIMDSAIILTGISSYPLIAAYYSKAHVVIASRQLVFPQITKVCRDGYIQANKAGHFNVNLLQQILQQYPLPTI